MISRISKEERYFSKHDWLSTYHLFSFADYYDQLNMNFGVLRVFNDDTVDGENGFGAHSHRDTEIVTILLEGELSHQDSMGNKETIRKGEVQYMSAGTGVVHAEINESKQQTHLYQLWLFPRKGGLTPTYDQKDFSVIQKNMFTPVASGYQKEGAIRIESDATIYKGLFEKDFSMEYKVENGNGVFIYITNGSLEINGIVFTTGDQARIENEESLTISSTETTECVMVEVGM